MGAKELPYARLLHNVMETKSRHAKIEMQVEPRDAQANHWKYGERTPIYIGTRDAHVYERVKELLYTQMRPPQRTTSQRFPHSVDLLLVLPDFLQLKHTFLYSLAKKCEPPPIGAAGCAELVQSLSNIFPRAIAMAWTSPSPLCFPSEMRTVPFASASGRPMALRI